ncbi:MAG TPA: CHASE3 domain-containing protein [Streptosporangiaceae bacterium]|nr:CHASE3 domain-containing protein [Streptosporangiaceae bacterium]
MTRPDPAAPPRFTGLTVRGWFRLVFAAIVVFVLAASVIIAVVLARSRTVSSRLNGTIQPAEAQAYLLQLSLLQQQSSVRGYVISREPSFLSPYTEGLATEHRAAAELRRLIGRDQPMAADLTRVEQAAAQWRAQYAVPLIDLAKSGAPAGQATILLDGSEQAFTGLRGLFDAQNQHLSDQVIRGSASLGRVRAVTNWTFIIILIAFLVAAGALAVVLNYAVLQPLNRIRSSARRVVAGDFEHRIAITGPADLRAVASDIEAMRSRLVAAAEAARAAQEFAASQAADLDAQAAELIRSNAELEQFAYVASHDLQEPLRKVASFCQLLEKRYGDQLDERGRQYIDFAVDGAKRLQVLINDLLTFSRVGRGHEVRTEVPLGQPLDSAISALDAVIEDQGAVIDRPDELPAVNGDATLLAMLWQNLISNGIKFAREGEPPRITITCAEAPDSMWRICVADNGIGVAPEFSDKIFIIFQRLHGRDAYPGTGIGLALCKRIVEYHGGEISLDATYSGGTRICFTLPRIRPAKADPDDATSSASAEGIPA